MAMNTASVPLVALLTIALGGLFQNIFTHIFGGKPLPPITNLFLQLQWWVFLAVAPFIGTANWLTFHATITPERVLALAGVSTLVIAFLLAFAVISLSVPLMTLF